MTKSLDERMVTDLLAAAEYVRVAYVSAEDANHADVVSRLRWAMYALVLAMNVVAQKRIIVTDGLPS